MSRPLPTLHVPTPESKAAMIRALYALGYSWIGDVERSVSTSNKQPADWHARTSYVTHMNNSIWFLNVTDLNHYLGTRKAYTLVNSLPHLIAYLKASK